MGLVCKLEDDLIPYYKWAFLYESMPTECKNVASAPLDCIGIGKNHEYGWFIMGSGQGPSLLWSEIKMEK